MFSRFFIDPLFTESGTAREVNAVDSEFALSRQDDMRREWQARQGGAGRARNGRSASVERSRCLEGRG